MPVRRYALLVLMLMWPAILGCAARINMTRKAPTKERPIVECVVNERRGLLFGGEDGTRRIVLPRTGDVRAFGISPSGRLAAALTAKCPTGEAQVTFYGPSEEVIATIDLPKTGEESGGIMWLGDRGEAVFLIHNHNDSAGGYQARPLSPPRKSGTVIECLYVNKAGAIERFGLSGPVRQVYFTDRPGFSVLQWANAGHGGGPNAWLLSRFTSPSELAWEAMIVTTDWVYLPSGDILMCTASEFPSRAGPYQALAPDFDVSVELRRGHLHFRRDATHVFEKSLCNVGMFAEYKKRTGAFYEAAFLVRAVDQLAQVAGLTALEWTAASAVLRDFIHDYLDTYVKDGGEIVAEDHQACLARVDKAMAARLSESKFRKYLEWRSFKAGSTNALGFLFRPPVVVRPEDSFWVTVITPPAK